MCFLSITAITKRSHIVVSVGAASTQGVDMIEIEICKIEMLVA